MPIQSFNPATEEVIKDFPEMSEQEIENKLAIAQTTFESYRNTDFAYRKERLLRVAKIFRDNAKEYASTMAIEMGKPLSNGLGEVEKCATLPRILCQQCRKIPQR